MLVAEVPSASAFGITGQRWIRRPGRMPCLGLRPHARSTSAGGGTAGWKDCFRAPKMNTERNDEMEIVLSSEDLWAEGIEGSSVRRGIPEHLVIMVNGLVGSAEDWRFAAELFIKKHPGNVIVHRSECNSSRLTFDGVDLMGERLADELPFLCGLPFLERRASEAAHLIVGRTGKHLFLTDDDGRAPLLLRMVDDGEDIKFMSALRSFKRRVVYANANYDHMVGWRTSSIRRQQELPKYHLLVEDERYPHIVHSDKGDNKNAFEEPSSDVLAAQKYDLEEAMIRGLTQVPWERVDVSFQKSRQRYIAHNTIQVKSYWLNSDGADVVSHLIDNFLI